MMVRKIKLYKVIKSHISDHHDFATAIEEHIKAGWQPFGSLTISNNYGQLIQALVVYEMKEVWAS